MNGFRSYVRDESRPGRPLPYHPRFGLTEVEFLRYLELVDERKVISTGTQLSIEFSVDGSTLTLRSSGIASFLDQFSFDLESTEAFWQETSLGLAGGVVMRRTDIPTGPWEGYEWSYRLGSNENLASGDRILISITLLRLFESGDFMWIVKHRERTVDTVRNNDIMFKYPNPDIPNENPGTVPE